jgi:cytochrome c-type biogenesis protein CcmH/NrfF
MVSHLLNMIPWTLWIASTILILLAFIPVVLYGKYTRYKKEQEKKKTLEQEKKAWNATAPMKVPGRLSDLDFRG